MISDNATNGKLNFDSITIDGETQQNVVVPGLNIVPGQRYNLNIDVQTCRTEILGLDIDETYRVNGSGAIDNKIGTVYNSGDLVEKLLNAPCADYGFQFDIYELDNTFDMDINGIKIGSKEIQFQTSERNVQFVDGSIYEENNAFEIVGAIWSLSGTAVNSIVRVIISSDGKVTLFGSKVSGGPLFPLVLTNGNVLQDVTWNTGGENNIVKMAQLIEGGTRMRASGKGVIRCVN